MKNLPIKADVLLLAAGFGKRLNKITEKLPKPLLQVGGKSLIERNLALISRCGFKRVFINLHYLSEQLKRHVGSGERWGLKVEYVEENPILDTGGAIKNIESLLDYDLLITLNSDIIISPQFSIIELLTTHRGNQHRPVATLVLKPHPDACAFGEIGTDQKGLISYFIDQQYGASLVKRGLIYTGIQVIERSLIAKMPQVGTAFSITKDFYTKVLSDGGGPLGSFIYEGYWNDVGTPQRLEETEEFLSRNPLF